MSAFLGKIHYWLYNKIQLHEELIISIVGVASKNGFDSDTLLKDSYSKYGFPVAGQLENEIEHSNIHGWLQEKIVSVETRLAYITTELLNKGIINKEDIADVYYKNGEKIAGEFEASHDSPEEVFSSIFNYMLEGMPCDRVNNVLESSDRVMAWETTRDLHKEYWSAVGGDVENFHYFRASWINGFLNASGTGYKYSRNERGINEIRKVC